MCKCAKCPPIDQCYKHCLYGFETNSLGCPVCKCRRKIYSPYWTFFLAKSRIDARLMIKEKDAQKHVDSCISVMDDNKYVERDSGEWWTDNHCRQCFCQHKLVRLRLKWNFLGILFAHFMPTSPRYVPRKSMDH